MNLQDVKMMTEKDIWIDRIEKLNGIAYEHWLNDNNHEAAAELRADIENRGLQDLFIAHLWRAIGTMPNFQVPYSNLFAICNATPLQTAMAYLLTVSEAE